MLTAELKAVLDKAEARRAAILEELEPLRVIEEKIISSLHPINLELRNVRDRIMEIEKTRGLADASRTIAALKPTQR
jgi:predicted  nucleic acid-binding Zn-ribbon protein